MLATTGPLPRAAGRWAYEVKWDGMRAVAVVRDGRVRLRARTGNEITDRYPELAELGALHDPTAGNGSVADVVVVDGEVVMFDDDGRPSFGALQHRMHIADPNVSRRLAAERSVVFVAFDLLWDGTGSCCELTYDERRARLAEIEFVGERVLVPSAELGEPDALVDFCRSRSLEGIVAKRRDSIYRPGRRTQAWVKTKFITSQELVVIGWTEGTGARSAHLGALLLGYHDDGILRFAGKVGTGFSDAELRALRDLLAGTEVDTPVAEAPRMRTPIHWVEPRVVVEVAFVEWSPGGHLRHPTYRGRRADVDPRTVVREPTP